MRARIALILIFISFSNNTLKAQERTARTYTEFPRCEIKLNGQYFEDYWHDIKYIVSSPVRWKKNDWLRFGAVIGTGAALYLADQEIYDWVQANRSSTTEDVAHVTEVFGNGTYVLIATGAIYLYGVLLKKQKSRRIGLLLLESYLITGMFTQFTKYMTGRWRPYNFPDGTDPKYNYWEGPRFVDPRKSFFSGHSATAFSMATTFAVEFRDKPWVGVVAYTLASLTSMSRVHDRAHWPSDIFLGSAVGLFMTKTIIKRHTCEGPPKALIYPSFQNGSQGIGFRYSF